MRQDNDFFLDFLTHFCNELTAGNAPEYALDRTMHYFGEHSPNQFAEALHYIKRGSKSFNTAWTDIANSYQGSKYFRIVELLGRFIEKGSKVAGKRMITVLKQVRKNQTLAKNRRNLVTAQKAKIISLSLVASAVLGMIAGIAPVFSFMFFDNLSSNHLGGISMTLSLPIFLALFLTVIVTGYRLNQTVGNSTRNSIICAAVFVFTTILTVNLLSALL